MEGQKYNYNKLRGLIREHFGSQKAYADALGISLTTLNSRLNSETYFDQREIEASAEFFALDADGVDQVFFLRIQYGKPYKREGYTKRNHNKGSNEPRI